MMKFNFKIQQYQTDAVNAVAEVFRGQPFVSMVSYRRDLGTLPAAQQQLSLVSSTDAPDMLSTEELRWRPARARLMYTSRPCSS